MKDGKGNNTEEGGEMKCEMTDGKDIF